MTSIRCFGPGRGRDDATISDGDEEKPIPGPAWTILCTWNRPGNHFKATLSLISAFPP